MHFLSKAKSEAFQPKLSLVDKLKKSIGGFENPRGFHKIHASSVTKEDFCPRKVALMDVAKVKEKQVYINTALRVTFDVGEATGDLFRERWAADWCYGNWICIRCGAQTTFTTKPKLNYCGSGHCTWKYREMEFVSEVSKISGSLDAVCDLGAPKLFVTELKIMAPDQWEELQAPLSEHRLRTSLYMRLIDESNSPYKERFNLERGKVLYISRAYGKKHKDSGEVLPFKEFDVVRNDKDTQAVVNAGAWVKNYKETGKIPEGVCGTSNDKRAKSCQVCKLCFSGDFPVGIIVPKED